MVHLKIRTAAPFLKLLKQREGSVIVAKFEHNKVHKRRLSALSKPDVKVCAQEFVLKAPFPWMDAVTGHTIPEFIWKDLKAKVDSPALECAESGTKLTHGDVHRQSRNFAAALLKSGLKSKDVISVVLPNNLSYSTVLLGIWEAGLIASPANPGYTADEIVRQVTISEAKAVITTPEFLPAIKTAKKSCPHLNTIIVIGTSQDGCHSFYEMLSERPNEAKFLKGSQIDTREEVALLPFSSGTTGPPKGVELTHSNICSNLAQMAYPDTVLSKRDDGKQDKLIGILPFYHSYGLTVNLLMNHYLGTQMLCIPKFKPDAFVKQIKYFKPTVLTLVTPLVSFLATTPDLTAKDFASVERAQVGACPVGLTLAHKFLKKADKPIFFQELYGLTELSPGTLTMNQSKGNSKLGSCGTLLPGTEGMIIDVNTGKSLGPGQRGELCVKGHQLMKGYFRNPEATKNVIDADGWFHTGDIGYYDEDGCFYIVDRLKELIKVKGLQVAPAELEDELRKHSEVLDVAVIGIPDEKSGELPRAYIVKKSHSLTESNMHEFLKGKISKHKELKGGIEFVEAIPKAPSGKILRRELKSDYMSKHIQK